MHFGKSTAVHRKIHRHTPWRIAAMIVVGLMFACLILSAYFIHMHVYRILDNQAEIVVLRAGASLDVVDTAAVEKAKKILNSKEFAVPTSTTRNIFTFPPSQNVTTTTSTSATTSSLE